MKRITLLAILLAINCSGSSSDLSFDWGLRHLKAKLANGSGVDFAPPGSVDAGSNRRAASVIWEWVAERQHAVVWPPAFATHPIDAMAIDR